LANKKNKFVNYFDGKLYFYKDEDKNIKIGDAVLAIGVYKNKKICINIQKNEKKLETEKLQHQ